jgi:pilus assembly protein Flp/PilA
MMRKLRGRRGQGMTEYIIIVALIAIAAIGVVGLFGDNIRDLFATSANALAGNEETTSSAVQAGGDMYVHKNLKEFGTKNTPTGS